MVWKPICSAAKKERTTPLVMFGGAKPNLKDYWQEMLAIVAFLFGYRTVGDNYRNAWDKYYSLFFMGKLHSHSISSGFF